MHLFHRIVLISSEMFVNRDLLISSIVANLNVQYVSKMNSLQNTLEKSESTTSHAMSIELFCEERCNKVSREMHCCNNIYHFRLKI